MAIEFRGSEDCTVGVEIEVQLINRDTLSLTSTSTDIIDAAGSLDNAVKHELMMSNLEVVTKKCSSVKEARDDLTGKLKVVWKEASRFNTTLCLSGTHPFSRWRDQSITDDPRYKRLLHNLQFIARRFNIFGLHVHVGVKGGEKCIYIMNRMLYYLPHLLALSVNSPFWEGDDTGLKSYRTKVFENLPIAGLPFYFDDWADYSRLVENYIKTDTIRTIRELWWDVRPHPDFGTIEIRVCDMPAEIAEVAAIAAFVQAIVKKFGDDYEEGVPFERPHSAVIRENKWRACRYGLEGEFVTERGDSTVDVRRSIEELLESVEEGFRSLGSLDFLDTIARMIEGASGAEKQLSVWKESGSLKDVVGYLVERLSKEVGDGLKGE